MDARILLSAGVPSASVGKDSKAVVNTGDTFTAGIAGWESSSQPDYASAGVKWQTTTSVITASASPQVITLTDEQVYNADKNIRTWMKAWYPAGRLSGGKVTFERASDGTADVLLSAELSGSKSDRTGKTLAFSHVTTQLKFVVKGGAGLADDTRILEIKIKNAGLPTGLDLKTDALTVVTGDLTVPGIDGSLVIGSSPEGDAVGDPVMIAPVSGKNVVLDITTSAASYPGVTATIDGDDNFLAGKAYTITLTFSQSALELQASLAEWAEGTGSGNVE